MTTFIMEARENYAAPILATLMTDDQQFYCNTQQFVPSVSFDAVRGKILYSFVGAQNGFVDNPKAVALWSGQILIDVGDSYQPKNTPVQNAPTFEGFYICEKNVSTDAVTFNDTFDATSLVPNGIGGSDGTYQRFVEAQRGFDQNLPKLVDPLTGNILAHNVMEGAQACAVYYFERAESFKHQISPCFADPAVFASGAHMEPLGVTADWWFIEQQQDADDYIGLSPRVVTADEIADDYKQIYASFEHPLPADTNYARHCFDADGNLIAFGRNMTGSKTYELHRMEPPTSAPYGGPVVGGGFSDETPWTAGSGPDSTASAYDLDGSYLGGKNLNKQFPYYLPATDAFALFEVLLPADKTGGTQADFKMGCTYADLNAATYDHHAGFVTGYMSAAWAPTTLGSAAYAVLGVRESNRYRETSSYTHADDYTKRWFCFVCNPVTAGVVDDTQVHYVFVRYGLVSGSAPAVLTVIDEQGWDDAYADYGTTIGDVNVVAASGSNDTHSAIYLDDFIALDGGGSVTFWFSGQDNTANSNTFHLDGFDDRADYGGIVTPFLRLTLTEEAARRRQVLVRSYVGAPNS